MIARGLLFCDAKDLHEIRLGSPLQGCQMQAGWVKMCDFRQIADYISKMVQDICMVSVKVE